MTQPVRGTQTLVDQMGWVFKQPTLSLLEIAWRWLFGLPFLYFCWLQFQQLLVAVPPDSAGVNNLDSQNPWIAAVQFGSVWGHYLPHVAVILQWLAPAAAVVWVVVSSVGRSIVFKRLEPGVRFRPLAMMPFQAGWIVLLGLTFWSWYSAIQWIAATHISPSGSADLVGYAIWAIFLSLGLFSLWAVVSWPFVIAEILILLEDVSPAAAFVVMGIVKMMLIVLAMVFSAAPLPFSDQLGPGALRAVTTGAFIFYLVSNDYFQVVRLKSFIEFWRTFRGEAGLDSMTS
jgi:hypothetical protein